MERNHADMTTQQNAEQHATRLVRFKEASRRTAVSIGTLRNLVDSGDFPQPVYVTPRCAGFFEDELDDWIEQQRRRRDAQIQQPRQPERASA